MNPISAVKSRSGAACRHLIFRLRRTDIIMTDWKKIRAFTFDIDGVLTDGTLLAVGEGEYVRRFNVKDNFAIRAALMYGYKIGVFTGGFGEGITDRMRTASVPEEDVYMRCRGKIKIWEGFCAKHGLKPEEVLYIGDDIPDLQIMRVAGIGPPLPMRRWMS